MTIKSVIFSANIMLNIVNQTRMSIIRKLIKLSKLNLDEIHFVYRHVFSYIKSIYSWYKYVFSCLSMFPFC